MGVKSSAIIKTLVAVTFLVMIIVNVLANVLPINGVKTGQVSDSYPNLFAPAGITFAVWGLIYLLLAGYTLYQLGFFQTYTGRLRENSFEKVGIFFSASSIANTLWIFSWHYQMIALSMLLMVIILICLIMIVQILKTTQLTIREKLFVRLPFSVYFGWITVATIANATTLLVSLGWDGFGIPEHVWTVVIILIGLIIGIATMLQNQDVAYGLVLIWAYSGIWLKHVSESGFAGQYPIIITTVIVCLVLLIITEVFILINQRSRLIR